MTKCFKVSELAAYVDIFIVDIFIDIFNKRFDRRKDFSSYQNINFLLFPKMFSAVIWY